MAWTAPRTWVTGEIVTAALMNAHVRDNLNALNARLVIADYNDVTGSRAIDTNYQNTAGGIKFVIVTVTDTGTAHWHVFAYIGSSSPASNKIAEFDGDNDYNVGTVTLSFIVPPSYYYRVHEATGSNFTLDDWHEIDMVGPAS